MTARDLVKYTKLSMLELNTLARECGKPVQDPDQSDLDMQVVVRYQSEPVPCRVAAGPEDTCTVDLLGTARFVAPGQAAVFYDGNRVLGGGFIDGK